MNKPVLSAIVLFVVSLSFSLLQTFGVAGIPSSPPTIAAVSSAVCFPAEGEKKQFHNVYRSHAQTRGSGNDSGGLLGSSVSEHRMPLWAHFDASRVGQRRETAPCEIGEDLPCAKKKDFLLSVDRVAFSCSEDACDHYYRQCGLDIEYTLYSGRVRSPVSDAVIICRAKIIYRTKGGYQLNSEAEPEKFHHVFRHNVEFSSRLSLYFHFSKYEQVTEVQLDQVACRVHPGDYLSGVTESLVD